MPPGGSSAPASSARRAAPRALVASLSDLLTAAQEPDALARCHEIMESEVAARTQPLREQLHDLQRRSVALDARIAERDDQIRALMGDLRAKDEQVNRLLEDIRAKDGYLRTRDEDLRVKDGDLRAKDRRLAEKTDELEALNADHAATVASLREASTDLLHERGKLHMRGVLEYIEEREQDRIGYPYDTARAVKWELILGRHPALARCLLEHVAPAARGRGPDHEAAARLIPRVYAALSMRHHPVVSPVSTRGANLLTLNDDGQEALYTAMLSCLCRHYHLSFARVRASGRTHEAYEATGTGLPAFGQLLPRAAAAKLATALETARDRSVRRAGER